MLLALLLVPAGCGDDDDERVDNPPQDAARIRLSSPAFIEGSRLPEKYTCEGAGDEPLMQAGTVPPSTRELVLIVSDPDASGSGAFVHLTRFGLSPRGDGTVSEGGQEGENSRGDTGWTPPCPPEGDDPHRYVWSVYALRDPSGLRQGAQPGDVEQAVSQGVLAAGTITARYGR